MAQDIDIAQFKLKLAEVDEAIAKHQKLIRLADPTSTVLRKTVAEFRRIAGGATGCTVMWC